MSKTMNVFISTFDDKLKCTCEDKSIYWTQFGNSKPYTDISKKKYYIKIITLGDSDTGKSSLIRSFCKCSACLQDSQIQKKIMKNQKCHNKQIYLNDNHVDLRIFDTAGEERYRSITPSYYRGAHGCILMFDVTKPHTFESISTWFSDLNQHVPNPENLVTILVGTKCHSTQRKIDRQKAQAFADHMNITYMEISSEENINITELFETLITNIFETFKQNPESQLQPDISLLLGKQDRRSAKEKCSC